MMLIPIRDNEGEPFDRADSRELERRLLEFGGFTRFPDVEGVWRDDHGRTYSEPSRHYAVAIDSWFAFPAWLDTVQWARERFRQETIYMEVAAGMPEIIGESQSEV